MTKCRKEAYCKWGIEENEEGEVDYAQKDPKRCFKCIATSYSMFEPYEDDSENESEEEEEE
ncbi:MAG: hypothetical protein KJ574_03900 [Nanoarchaeota archaeon]|nr:hypothetical protein [Nanoarchaeota archaeon]